MEFKYIFKKLIPILVALILIISSILMLIPATRDGILNSFGLGEDKPVYNGFEPFVPFIPGYFPEDFEITQGREQPIDFRGPKHLHRDLRHRHPVLQDHPDARQDRPSFYPRHQVHHPGGSSQPDRNTP